MVKFAMKSNTPLWDTVIKTIMNRPIKETDQVIHIPQQIYIIPIKVPQQRKKLLKRTLKGR